MFLTGSSPNEGGISTITLIGAGHVFRIRETIKYLIQERGPQVVCVELDPQRYEALLGHNEDRKEEATFMMKRMMKTQEKFADLFGGEVGEEMLSGIDTALMMDSRVAFIDYVPNGGDVVDIFKELPLKEKALLVGATFTAPFLSKKMVEKELKKFEKNPEKLLDQMAKYLPTLKPYLIDRRDQNMANGILRQYKQYPDIVAVIGDGHVPGMTKILSKKNVPLEIIRLSQVRKLSKRIPKEKDIDHEKLRNQKPHRIKWIHYCKEWTL